MLIALFALANLPVYRKQPPPPPLQPTPSSQRCGKAREQYSSHNTDLTASIINSNKQENFSEIDTLTPPPPVATTHTSLTGTVPHSSSSSKMSSNVSAESMQLPSAANGNQIDDSDDVEIVAFKSSDQQCCRSIKTNRTRVYTCSKNTTWRGSSKVKLKNVVDYKWETKYYYPGHLVAVHRDGKHLAYAINVNNKATGMEGMVRVCNTSAGLRALIKGMNGEVLDLQFAHTERDRILAIIDVNSLFVYKIDLIEGNLVCNLILKVEDPIANYVPKYDMLSWCPYVTNSTGSSLGNSSALQDDDDQENQLLIWSRSAQFQCFHVKMIVSEHGRGKIQPAALDTGYLKIEEDALITCAALSPDGTTVAAACADGLVRFYQIYLFDVRNHRCLHEWKPHDGKLVSSLFFLDNINKPVEDAYWQYVITTSDHNTEIKLWNCSLWECLQTINIVPNVPGSVEAQFIAGIDRSANYLVISSLDSLAVYVMQIANNNSTNNDAIDSDSDNGSSVDDAAVRIQNIAEFKLSSGILSFSIVNASMRRMKSTNESLYPFEEHDDYDEETNATYALVLHMFVVQSKSLQECQIIYQPCVADKVERGLNSNTNSIKSLKHADEAEDALLLQANPDLKQETLSSPNSNNSSTTNIVPLDALFAKVQQRTPNASNTTSSSAVVAVAVAAAAAPSAVLQEAPNKSRSTSPQYASAYPQVNLMTPDAFSASASTALTVAAATVSTTTTTAAGDGLSGSNPVSGSGANESVNSQVLNTLRMLATVTGQNLMNNPLIGEQNKLQEKLDSSRKKFISIDRNPERKAAENMASGGSSPSREVQEILATQEDADAYEAELANLDDEEEEANSTPLLEENLDDEIDIEVSKWLPEAPKLVKKSAELQNAANIMSQAVIAVSGNGQHVPPTLGSSSGHGSNNTSSNNNTTGVTLNTSTNSGSGANENCNSEMNAKLDQLMELVKAQSQQLNKLENELAKLQKPSNNNNSSANPNVNALLQPKTVNELAYKIEMQLSKLMEQYLKRYENEHKKKLAEFLAVRESQNRELRESIIQLLNQYIMNHFAEIIGNVLNMELQRQIVPRVNAKMDQLQQQVQVEVVQKLGVFDKTIKENIAQVCKSKQFLDTFGKSVLVGIQTSLQTAFIDSMSNTLIPAYEKSSQNMFKQLHEAFTIGLNDFKSQFNAYMQSLPPHFGANSDEIHNKLSLFRQHIESQLNKQSAGLTDTMLETQREVKSLEILLARQIQETIRNELRKYTEAQTMQLRSQTATPAPTYDLRDTIKQLLNSGQINKAFHQALLANDLNLVEFTLRQTDPSLAFTPEGCRLEQKVLLSLIQQISADMNNHNELKQSYLNEALLAINMSDPITREHAPKVLAELFRNCQLFIKNYPKNTQCSNVRLLMKAMMSYRDQFK